MLGRFAGRRQILKGMGASVAACGPWIISRSVLASSGTINVMVWSDHLSRPFLNAFRASTGIEVNIVNADSNEDMLNRMRASNGGGIDVVSPTNMRSPQWADLGLLRPIDSRQLPNIENLHPSMAEVGDTEWNFDDEGSHWLPWVWGTEGIGWRSDLWQPTAEDNQPSYGDLWQKDVAGKVMMRAYSGMLGAGLYLESIDLLPSGAMKSAYQGPDEMRRVWQVVTEFCIENRSVIKLFWNSSHDQTAALSEPGVVIGQTWDGPVLNLRREGHPVRYQAPREGALAWIDGLAISRQARDLQAVYAFIDFCLNPEVAGRMIDGGRDASWGGKGHGYNSAVAGSEQFASENYGERFRESYPGKALSNLWSWPAEPRWYADLRADFVGLVENA